MEEIQDLSKQTVLIIQLIVIRSKLLQKVLQLLKIHKVFKKDIKEGYITLEQGKEKEIEFNLEINEAVKGNKKPEEQKNAIKNISH